MITARKLMLDAFLEDILTKPELVACADMVDFLCPDPNDQPKTILMKKNRSWTTKKKTFTKYFEHFEESSVSPFPGIPLRKETVAEKPRSKTRAKKDESPFPGITLKTEMPLSSYKSMQSLPTHSSEPPFIPKSTSNSSLAEHLKSPSEASFPPASNPPSSFKQNRQLRKSISDKSFKTTYANTVAESNPAATRPAIPQGFRLPPVPARNKPIESPGDEPSPASLPGSTQSLSSLHTGYRTKPTTPDPKASFQKPIPPPRHRPAPTTPTTSTPPQPFPVILPTATTPVPSTPIISVTPAPTTTPVTNSKGIARPPPPPKRLDPKRLS